MKKRPEVVGATTEGLLVVSNTFRYYDSSGLSIMDILTKLKSMGMVPDLLDFYVHPPIPSCES